MNIDRNKFDRIKFPNVWKGHNYAADIIDGKIKSSKYLKGACKRYIKDLERTDHIFFDVDAAERYLRLVQKFHHTIGKWETDTIIYEPWQCWVWMNIMGFMNKETGFRRFRTAHIEVARGNGKSPMASQAVLFFLSLDNPVGNLISTVATKKDQARIVLDAARNMAKKNKSFCRKTGTKVLAHKIVHEESNSEARALSSDHSSMDGLNDILAVMDELHAMRSETFDVVVSGMSKRKDSLTLCITTAGFNTDGVGHEQSVYAKKVSLGQHEDDTFFAAVYCLDDKDDIWDQRNYIKANPNWGVSVDIDTFLAKVEKAKVTERDQYNLKVKHLNMWISEASPFFTISKFDNCKDTSITEEAMRGKSCRMAIDISSHIDLASIGAAFYDSEKKIYTFLEKTFIPEETLKNLRNPLFDNAVARGQLIKTPGEVLNHELFKEEVIKWLDMFNAQELMYDPWNAESMAQDLSSKVEVVKFAQNVSNYSEPMKRMDSLMREKNLRHNGSDLLRWCVGNVVAKEDHNGNVFPRKSHPKLKIDPVVVLLMSLAGWLQDENKDSVYEDRGIVFI